MKGTDSPTPLNETQKGIILDYCDNFLRPILNDLFILYIPPEEQGKYPDLVEEVRQPTDTGPDMEGDNSAALMLPHSVEKYFSLINAMHSNVYSAEEYAKLVEATYNQDTYPSVSDALLLDIAVNLKFVFAVCRGNIPSVNENDENKLVLDVERLGAASLGTIKQGIGRLASDYVKQWLDEQEKRQAVAETSPETLPFQERLELWKARGGQSGLQK